MSKPNYEKERGLLSAITIKNKKTTKNTTNTINRSTIENMSGVVPFDIITNFITKRFVFFSIYKIKK
jgi:hypothetical protein